MDVSTLIFRGSINAPGEWTEKIEKTMERKHWHFSIEKYLQSAHHTDTTINTIAHLLTQQTPTPNASVIFMAQVSPVMGGGAASDIRISWQPDRSA